MATQQEHAHFAAIAAAEAASDEESIRRALDTTPGERMMLGWRMGQESPWSPAHLAELDARTDGQMELARIRIARGLR